VGRFARYLLGRELRPYQAEVAAAIVRAVRAHGGRTLTVQMARQMGKNELSAVVECYLLTLHMRRGGTLVKAAPTWRPQVATSLLRVEGLLARNPLTAGRVRRRFGYVLEVGQARLAFYSGQPGAQVVGGTASVLLEIDEAQDFDATKYTKDFRPMVASTGAATVLYGTAWDGRTLLEEAARQARGLEAADGERRAFVYDWTVGAAANAAYGAFVAAERARLGAEHPLWRTQYALEAVAGSGRLFGAAELAQLVGTHARERGPVAGAEYVAGLDWAGEAESGLGEFRPGARRDSAVLTVARVRWRETVQPQLRQGLHGVREPELEVVEHYAWTGRKHRELIPQVVDLLGRVWGVRHVVVDATGVGEGAASYLVGALGERRVTPFKFTAASKSRLAYELLAAVSGGRLRLYRDDGSAEARECWRQVRAARYRVRAGQALEWDVDPAEGHDDFLTSLALVVAAAGVGPVRRAVQRAEGG
jgi:hypothetical protein